jgi:uncharacterized cupin superfamily protein
MSDPNVFSDEWQHELGGVRGTLVGAAAGARDLGATVIELPPGAQAAPYPLHHGNEEMLIVLSGTPELRTPAGVRTLEPGAVVAFVAGAEGAHRVSNASGEPCRYVMISTMRFPDVAEHVDTGATLAIREPGGGKVFPAGSESDVMEAVRAALAAEK